MEAGLPRNPPTGDDDSRLPWTLLGASTVMGALLLASAVVAIVVRRRPEAAPTR